MAPPPPHHPTTSPPRVSPAHPTEHRTRPLIGCGYEERCLDEGEVRSVFEEGLAAIDASGKRVLVILPDATRTGPIPLCFRLFTELLGHRVASLDFLIALGTHAPMDDDSLCRHLGITPEERAGRYARFGVFCHDWKRDLRHVATLRAADLLALTGGLMGRDVDVQINARVFDYDHLIVCGPVFPHEAMGFSGGNKYFFPGVSGPDVIDFFHWLSALITNLEVIGRKENPVRKVVDLAASHIPVPRWCFSLVTKGEGLAGLYFGSPEDAQAAAADLSDRLHIAYLDRPYQTVLALMPPMYEDLWTAGKGMYKTEPVVAEGGRVIIYAPHVREISFTHGAAIDRIGYHVRDYFLAQMDQFRGVSPCVMAHSTFVKGSGTYASGIETPRANVVLATGIPRERCELVNLGFLDPATIRPEEWAGRESEGILAVPHAGELLYRLRG